MDVLVFDPGRILVREGEGVLEPDVFFPDDENVFQDNGQTARIANRGDTAKIGVAPLVRDFVSLYSDVVQVGDGAVGDTEGAVCASDDMNSRGGRRLEMLSNVLGARLGQQKWMCLRGANLIHVSKLADI